MSVLRTMLSEARQRGFWGTVQAVKLGRFANAGNRLVGEDNLGNKYYENRKDTYCRDRWVEYKDPRLLRQDPVNVPPEWHAWLLHNTDSPPSSEPLPKPVYQAEITPNLTGTPDAYIPANNPLAKNFRGHARGKIEAWVPPAAGKPTTPTPVAERDVLDLK
eukprot:CAMPEP_0198334982 /NCGR_PEP_ID=MMETSP1450-20131203/19993_1 /TAXON_ID=753684 ORGANISM="Madagascaria erythrocladiodes, Strain CCMP3234" /NCGR_SAMPLE_ID=MMETSP1450 /ASSEMBLY_ACC=CAM_ASM_001115 /LENGTH=160 /DNA_ID=CAMNT_0044039605 /DNA_START=87 /DNA_END=569 /DNA_ORIENTATION=-